MMDSKVKWIVGMRSVMDFYQIISATDFYRLEEGLRLFSEF